MTYTKEQIIKMCEKASEDMKSFYKANFVNYRGKTKKTEGGSWYSEIIAEWLLDHLDLFDIIHEVDRRITAAMFSIQDGFIYRNDRNTNISVEEFKIMNEEYSESSTPFFVIYTIIKQSPDYNAFDIFTILRKRSIVLKLLDSEKMD